MTENYHFQLFYAFSSTLLEHKMGYCYLRFYATESRPGREHLLNFPCSTLVSRPMKLGKIA